MSVSSGGRSQTARRGIKKYNVATVTRPPLELRKSASSRRTAVHERVFEANPSVEDTGTLDKGIATQLLLSEPYLKAPGCHVNLAPPIALTVLSGRLPNA